jgi:2-polyprenyl-3-methyl-5-hydroxy-6-metoxy-1,4-benzoquinol methylase
MNEKWNKKYAQSPLPLFGNKPSFICKKSLIIDKKELSPCLFIGDGEGRNSRYMAASEIDVTAIDLSEVATSKARDADYKSGLQITRMIADASKWSACDQKFKCCFMIFVHVDASEREAIFSNISSMLYKGGHFFMEGFSQAHLKHRSFGPSDRSVLYDAKTIIPQLPSFKLINSTVTDEILDNAPGHVGLASISRLHFTKTRL